MSPESVTALEVYGRLNAARGFLRLDREMVLERLDCERIKITREYGDAIRKLGVANDHGSALAFGDAA